MCIVWFCGDRKELVILSKTEAENKMTWDGKERNGREFTFLPRERRLKLVSKVSSLNSTSLWFCDKGPYKKEKWLTEKPHSVLGAWATEWSFPLLTFEFEYKQGYLICSSESVRAFCLGKNKQTSSCFRVIEQLILFSVIPVSMTVKPSHRDLKLNFNLRRTGMPKCKQLVEKSSLAHTVTNFWCSCICD